MRSTNRALIVIAFLVLLGAWGCAQHPGSGPGSGSARIRDLESRNAKLEEDHRQALANRDQARKAAAALEESQVRLQEELQSVGRERDELRRQIGQRTGERDTLQSHLVLLSKELQVLAGKIDSALNVTPPPTIEPSMPGLPAAPVAIAFPD